MAPAVVPRPKVRGAGPSVRSQFSGYLDDIQTVQRRADDHLARELHAVGLHAELFDPGLAKRAHPAVEVAHRDPEEQPPEQRQHRVAESAVQERHSSFGDAALETVAHHEIGSVSQRFHERADVVQRVTVIRVGHQHVFATRRGDSATQGRTVAATRNVHYSRPLLAGDVQRAVVGTVVGDQHLTGDPELVQRGARLADADRERLRLVQARHDDGQFEFRNLTHHLVGCARVCRRVLTD